MTKITDTIPQILTEYCGECWHEFGRMNKDFSTPDGWQLLADRLKERGEWKELYAFIAPAPYYAYKYLEFHEKQPAEKSLLVYEALKAGVIGGQNE